MSEAYFSDEQVQTTALAIFELMKKGYSAKAHAEAEALVAKRPDADKARQVAAAAALQDDHREKGLEHLLWRLKADPDDIKRLRAVATVLLDLERFAKAEPFLRRALELDSLRADLHFDMARICASQKKHAEAVHHYRVAQQLDPDDTISSENLIFLLDFVPAEDTARQQRERRYWFERFVKPKVRAHPFSNADADPEKKLRIGYVGGDFKLHSAARIFGPMVRDYDRDLFEVYCYYTLAGVDDETRRYQEAATVFREVDQYDDEGIARKVRADGIDILVDLATYSMGGRLGVFARRAAPVQISAWGHCHGTGLDSMDVLFSDAFCIPPDERTLFPEKIVDLPCVITFAEETGLPDPSPQPCDKNGYITFAGINRMEKITAETLQLWAATLAAVPGARLFAKAGGFEVEIERQRVWDAMRAAGVDPGRVSLAGSTERDIHLKAMSDCDIALDAYPHGGGMTTCEFLYMGVPVVALKGRAVAGRVSSSVLTTLGLGDLVAETPGAYVDKAKSLAADPARLRGLRTTLRQTMLTHPAFAPRAYVPAVEAVYRDLWRQWCDGRLQHREVAAGRSGPRTGNAKDQT